MQENDRWRIQSDSNFCTVGIVLNKLSDADGLPPVLYYEVGLVTGGIMQVGWATPAFRPDSENGDGVGDCKHSWGFDGSRSIKLHNETTESYCEEPWKAGDVVGCRCNYRTGEISYTVNGKDVGVAFQRVPETVFPVVSCNPGEVVEFRLTAAELKHRSAGVTAVGDIMATQDVTLDSLLEDLDGDDDEEKVPAAIDDKSGTVKQDEKKEKAKSDPTPQAVVVEPLDLDKYGSVHELEKLGLERLKGALMAIGLKCGGTVQERASRLFSVRGLNPADYPKKLLAKKQEIDQLLTFYFNLNFRENSRQVIKKRFHF